MKRVPLSWSALSWPREVTPEQMLSVFGLIATTGGSPMILEAVGHAGTVQHRFAVPSGHAANVARQIQGALPGIRVDELSPRPTATTDRAIELRLTAKRRSLRTDDIAATSRAVLTALSDLKDGESLSLLWLLGPTLRPYAVPSHLDSVPGDSLLKDLALAPLGKSIPVDTEVRNALRIKQSEAGWKVAGRIGVHAAPASRQRQLVRHVLAALRTTEAPGIAFWVRSTNPRHVAEARQPWRYPLRLRASELAGVSSWPVGATGDLPVEHQRSRVLAPSSAIPTDGRVIGEATASGRERPLAISPTDSLRHTYVLGPSGVGKSTLLGHLIEQDMVAGRAVAVIEPKSDLIADVLAHVPPNRIDDVVVLDPKDALAAVGINPLAGDRRHPELIADQLLAIFKNLYGTMLGPRTTDILAASLHTLVRVPGATLIALPLILSDEGYRHRAVSYIDDPIALEPFWAAFENWSEAARSEAIAPLLNKVRPLLLRPQLRAVLGQAQPRFDVLDVFTKRRILLVDASKGALGPETSALLASLVIAQLWSATLRRSSIAPERRHPVSIYLDEFQDYLRLPTDLGDALAQARGLGVGFTLANQYLHQLDPSMRSALSNVQNRVCFNLAEEDAKVMAGRGTGLDPEDFTNLGAYQFYARTLAAGTLQPWCSGRSLAPAPPTSDPSEVRAASRSNFGRPLTDVDAEIRALVRGGRHDGQDDLTPRRRGNGGAT